MTPPPKKKNSTSKGSVAFVGAGPGDPGLLTVRAVELLASADIVVTESQDAAFVARFCRPDVEVIDGSVGDDGQPHDPCDAREARRQGGARRRAGRPAARR